MWMHEFTVALNAGMDVPLYEQLVSYVIGEIKSGRIVEGEKLPSKRALCAHLGVSMSTVEAAYQILDAEGYIEGRARSGYYAAAYEVPMVGGKGHGVPKEAAEVRNEAEYAYRFSTAEVDTGAFPYGAWAKLYKKVVQEGAGLLLRGHPQGDVELRAALADFLHQYRGVNCGAEQIVIGAGAEQLIGMMAVVLGDVKFALEDPGYRAVYRAMENNRREYVGVGLDGAGMMVDVLVESGAEVAYVTPSHQFPTGITMTAGRRARLLDWANAKEGRFVIEDDYDSEFRHLTRPIPAMQGMDGEKVIYLGTFNRSIAPSVRVAYLVLPEGLLGRFREKFFGMSATVSRFEQQALSRFIVEGHYARHLRRMSGVYRRRRDVAVGLFGGIEGVRVSGDEAGLHFLVRCEGMTERALVEKAGAVGVLVHGLSEYGHRDAESGDGGTLVIGYGGMDERDMSEAVELLKEAWNRA